MRMKKKWGTIRLLLLYGMTYGCGDLKEEVSNAGGVPFPVTLPKVPDAINADLMTNEQLHTKLKKGYDDIEAGRVQNAANAFAKFREHH